MQLEADPMDAKDVKKLQRQVMRDVALVIAGIIIGFALRGLL
jgi:hypothetical protein